ncbi:MAG: aminopeptidase N [Arenicellales bacterium WSBS_2016_MAG_OTU3]
MNDRNNPPPETTAKTHYLRDYKAPGFLIDHLELRFDLDARDTMVTSRFTLNRIGSGSEAIVLHGNQLELVSLALNEKPLDDSEYEIIDGSLHIKNAPRQCALAIKTRVNPADNTSLMGLYLSGGNFCTQCEPEGFRKITFFPDRPDVLTTYTVTIIGDKTRYPEMLSNGNLIAQGDWEDGKHFTKWHDPWPKPSYLFALVAGKLAHIKDSFKTMGGRDVELYIFTEPHNIDKCDHAMESIKKSMLWDEQVYGREYDLERFMIVAVDDFNMGAMENKGLNVFNSKYVLAKPETATDADYEHIEGVIGHEYFHNWSGNRVTCRDWFQLSLKEGFTVFRDQEFSADMTSRGVKRIEEVKILREHQFREDSGPMAHPVRPESYEEINNFYTVTIYNKGAEVVRMLHTLAGHERFIKGTTLYFDRHDGQAVTTEEFVKAIEDANGLDLTQFRRWYEQAGTPEIQIHKDFDKAAGKLTLTFAQHCQPTPDQPLKKPFHIPLHIALLHAGGEAASKTLIELTEKQQTFVFEGLKTEPVLSMLRDFSAPVKLNFDSMGGQSDDELAFLMAHDNDAYNRWDAGQRLMLKHLLKHIHSIQHGFPIALETSFKDAFEILLSANIDDKAFHALAISLPTENAISQELKIIQPDVVHQARAGMKVLLATGLKQVFQNKYEANSTNQRYQYSSEEAGRRRLRNQCLDYLASVNNTAAWQLAQEQYNKSDNMTEQLAALMAIANSNSPQRNTVLDDFYTKWKKESLVLDKWLSIQAMSSLPDRLTAVKKLLNHAAFTIKNPNKVRALVGAFCHYNANQFHAANGEGYAFLRERVLTLDKLNPQGAAHLVSALNHWRRYDEKRQTLMQNELETIQSAEGLSKDVSEIVAKALVNKTTT